MELKAYAGILLRRWYLVALVPALVLVAVIFQFSRATPTYSATARLSVIRAPEQPGLPEFRYDSYYRYLASEFAVDDFVEVIAGNVFAADVAARLEQEGSLRLTADEVQAAISSGRKHRILNIEATLDDQDSAVLLAQAASRTLEEKGLQYFQVAPDPNVGATIRSIEWPTEASSNTGRQLMVYLLQLVAAAFAGVVIAFLVDYLDDALWTADAASSALAMPVIGTIPARRSSR